MVQMIPESHAPNGYHGEQVSTDPPLAMTQEPESPAGMMPPQVVIIFNGSDDAESPAARLHIQP